MTVPMVLLPVFCLVGLSLALMVGLAVTRRGVFRSGRLKPQDIALGWPDDVGRAAQVGNCLNNQFQLPVLFYMLVAIALPLRKMDLLLVLLSWVFVITRYAHAGIFVTSNNVNARSAAFAAGCFVVIVMWIWLAIRILFPVV